MALLFPLAEIADLGRRNVDGPTADDIAWAGMSWGADEVRVLQAAAQPTLMLAGLAGYDAGTAWVFSSGDDDALEIDLATRTPTVVPAGDLEVFPAVGGTPGIVVAVRLGHRAGLSSTTVAMPDLITVQTGDPFVVLPLGAAADVPAVVSALDEAQVALSTAMAQRIAVAAIEDGPAAVGLVSVLDPGLWDFPDAVLPEGSGERATLLRAVVDPVAQVALKDQNSLLAFLLEEALGRRAGVQLPSVNARLTGTVAPTQVPVRVRLTDPQARDLEASWKREGKALYDLLNPGAGRPPFRVRDHKTLCVTELVLDAVNQGLFGTVVYDPSAGVLAYGGLDLRYTRPPVPPATAPPADHDPDPAVLNVAQEYVYGGMVQSGTFTAAASVPGYVRELRTDLAAIGFGPLADGDVPAGAAATALQRRTFGPWLEAAVREFQIYASMTQVARKPLPTEPQPGGAGNASLASTLIGVENDHVYDGPKSGVLNARTRELVKMWVERDWHCPVVVETRALTTAQAKTMRQAGPATNRTATVLAAAVQDQNVWLARQAPRTNRVFVVWDHTRTATAPPYHAGEPMVVCGYSTTGWGGAFVTASGLASSSLVYPSAEISPVNVLPPGVDRRSRPAALSTFRVIRSVSEVECLGYFDGINGWDTAITSGGPLHQTLGLMKNARGTNPGTPTEASVLYPGELGAFLGYLQATEPAEFASYLGRYGVAPVAPWTGADGPQFVPAHRKYTGFLALQREDRTFADLRRPQAAGVDPVVSAEDAVLAETFKTWHWTHRILYMSRTSRPAARRFWEFTRARVRELLSTTWQVGGVTVQVSGTDADGNSFVRPATLGDMFTSERTVAALVRQHVFSPPRLFRVQDKQAQWLGAGVADINFADVAALYTTAVNVHGHQDPGLWGDDEQAALAAQMNQAGILTAANLDRVAAWPSWVTGANPWGYDRSWVDSASPAPVIDPIPNVTMPRAGFADVPVVVQSASAFPVTAVDLVVSPDAPGLEVSSLADGSGFRIEAGANAAQGRWTAKVTATDGVYAASLEFDVDVNDAADEPPSDTVYAPVVAAPNLDLRHGSFMLDADDLDPFPAP